MEQRDAVPWADLVRDRLEFLDRLADEPAQKPELEEDLECSRSTIDRAIRRLEAADLVTRVAGGYVATVTGRLAADRYRTYVADQLTLDEAGSVLSVLPHGCEIPFDLLAGGTVTSPDGHPQQVFERIARQLRGADRYRAVLPRLADSRHLRLLHARVVHDELDADLLVGSDQFDRIAEEFPRLVEDLVAAESCSIHRTEVPPFGLVVGETDDATSVVLVTYDGREYAGTVENDSDVAVTRADALFAAVSEDAEGVPTPPTSTDRDDGTPLSVDGMRAERVLADAGTTRLDRSFFTERTPGDPETAWRLGFDLIDVFYGYAVERVDPSVHVDDTADAPSGETSDVQDGETPGVTTDDTPEAPTAETPDVPGDEQFGTTPGTDAGVVSAALVDALANGTDQVVVGPAGAGKSTICRQVACRWIEADRGPVFYRESSATGDDLSGLPEVLSSTDGYALVVVEDAGDVTESFLRLVSDLRADPTVTVLGEARERQWHGAVDDVADPRLRELARTGVETYRPPSVDERTCDRAIDTFEAVTGREVPLTADALLDRVENEGGMGEMYVLSYQIVAHTVAVPWSDDAVGPSVLDGDVRECYGTLAPADGVTSPGVDDTLPLEVGLLVATLTAMERAVTPGLVHAVAAARPGDRGERAHRRVEAVIDELDGRMLVGRDDAGTYRTQHPQWATRFLEHALERAERESVATFERAVNAVLGLADSPDRRDRIESWLGRDAPEVRRFAESDALAEFVEDLFPLGFTRAKLAPLFGTTEHSAIDVPDACPERARLDAVSCRGKMWYDHGDAERAEAELTTLCERAEDADDDAVRATYLAEGYRGLGEVVVDRGDAGTARDYLERSLDAARDGADPRHEVGALNSLAWVAMTVDDYDLAREHLEEALSIAESLGPCGDHSDTLYYMSRLEQFRGDLEAAEEWLTRTVELDREIGNEGNLSSSLKLLADLEKERGAYDRAANSYRRSIELKRVVQDRPGMAQTLYDFGDLHLQRGDADAAESAFERSRSIARDNDMRRHEGRVRHGLGRVALERGDHETAARHFREQRQRHDNLDHRRGVASATGGLGDVVRERGDLDAARKYYRDGVETYRDVGDSRRALELLAKLVDVCEAAGEETAAREHCETAIDVCEDAGIDDELETFTERRESLGR